MKESVITTFPSFSINSLISKRTESNIDTLPRIFPFKSIRDQHSSKLCIIHVTWNHVLFLTLLYSIHFIDAFHAITPLISPRKDRSSNRIIEISIACLETRSIRRRWSRKSFSSRWDPFFVIELIRVHHLTLFTDRRWSKCLLRMDAPAFCSIDLADFSPLFSSPRDGRLSSFLFFPVCDLENVHHERLPIIFN